MSLWLRTRDENGRGHYVSVPFEPLPFVALVGITVAMLLPFLQMFRAAVTTSPVFTSTAIFSVLFVGGTLFTLAKVSVIRSGRLVTFGPRNMSRMMRWCYYVGYTLLAIGTIAVLLFIASASSG